MDAAVAKRQAQKEQDAATDEAFDKAVEIVDREATPPAAEAGKKAEAEPLLAYYRRLAEADRARSRVGPWGLAEKLLRPSKKCLG